MSEIKSKFSVGISRNNRDKVNLQIRDEYSGDRVLEVSMTLEQYALVVTGLHGVSVEGVFYDDAHIAQERESQTVTCEKCGSFDKDIQSALVLEHFKQNYEPYGWILQSDGTGSQQHGDLHKYNIKRYVTVGSIKD